MLIASAQYAKPNFLINFASLVIPIVLSVCWTEFTEVKLGICLIILIFYRKNLSNPFTNKDSGYTLENGEIRYEFITNFRSLLLIATCVSILAVDFQIYPRRFVKTEVKGVSLMDIGTGSVLFTSALVARHARGAKTLGNRVVSAVSSCLPLWIIGISKFFIHSAVDYQEHVSEYGVHWNFFMSLGVVVLFSSIFQLKPLFSLILSGLIMGSYQFALNSGLEQYILYAPRNNFISMNREGIFGCIGFFCIFQIGSALKQFLLVPGKELKNLFIAVVSFSLLSFAIGGESRRLVKSM